MPDTGLHTHPDPRLLGTDMRQARRSQEVSVQRVADRLDISEKTYRRFEQGGHDMRISQALVLCDMLGFEIVIRKKES